MLEDGCQGIFVPLINEMEWKSVIDSYFLQKLDVSMIYYRCVFERLYTDDYIQKSIQIYDFW